MKIVYRLLLVLLMSLLLFGCGRKGGTVEGNVIDGQGQPLSGVTLIFKPVLPVPGAEPLQAKTDNDGDFRISGLTPASEYFIIPETDKWTTKVTRKITAGQFLALSPPIAIRFQLLRNGTVIDTKTGLQWLIYTATDISANDVMKTVRNINEGSFTDWRLPTKAEILGLKDQPSTASPTEPKSAQQACCIWTAEINSDKIEWEFYTDDGNELWTSGKMPPNDRIVVVRTFVATTPMPQAPTVVVPSPPAAALSKEAAPSPVAPAPPAATVPTPSPTATVAPSPAPTATTVPAPSPAAKVAPAPAPKTKTVP